MSRGIKLIIAGDRNFNDYVTFTDRLEQVIKKNKWNVSEVVHGAAKGADSLADKWAKDNDVDITEKPAEWDNLKQEGAIIKERKNPWTKKMEKYNCRAGHYRNTMMAEYGDALVAFQLSGNTPGTQDMIKKAQERGLPVEVIKKDNTDFKYDF